jgi:hypothetical protein
MCKTAVEYVKLAWGSVKPIGVKAIGAVSQKASECQLVERAIAFGGLLKERAIEFLMEHPIILPIGIVCVAAPIALKPFWKTVGKWSTGMMNNVQSAVKNLLNIVKNLYKFENNMLLLTISIALSPIAVPFRILKNIAGVGAKIYKSIAGAGTKNVKESDGESSSADETQKDGNVQLKTTDVAKPKASENNKTRSTRCAHAAFSFGLFSGFCVGAVYLCKGAVYFAQRFVQGDAAVGL